MPEDEISASTEEVPVDTESDGDSSSVASPATSSASGSGAKKKKKRNRKKKKGGGGGGNSGGNSQVTNPLVVSEASGDALPKEEADKKFAAALNGLRADDESLFWVELAGCHIGEKKMRKLCEALKNNTTATGMKLCNNIINDNACKILAEALKGGAATMMVEIDLSGNPFTAAGQAELEAVKADNPQLTLIFVNSKLHAFETSPHTTSEMATEVSTTLQSILEPQATSADVCARLGKLCNLIDAEIKEMAGPCDQPADPRATMMKEPIDTSVPIQNRDDIVYDTQHHLSTIPGGLAVLVHACPLISRVLDQEPEPYPHIRKRIGRSRARAIWLVRALVIARKKCLDDILALSDVIHKCTRLFFESDWSSIVHQLVYTLHNVVFESHAGGSALAEAVCKPYDDDHPALQTLIARSGDASAKVDPGHRTGNAGLVLKLAIQLVEYAEKHSAIRTLLDGDKEWHAFEEKTLPQLRHEIEANEGRLGDNIPVPEARDTSVGDLVLPGGQQFTLQQFTQLLEQSRLLSRMRGDNGGLGDDDSSSDSDDDGDIVHVGPPAIEEVDMDEQD